MSEHSTQLSLLIHVDNWDMKSFVFQNTKLISMLDISTFSSYAKTNFTYTFSSIIELDTMSKGHLKSEEKCFIGL